MVDDPRSQITPRLEVRRVCKSFNSRGQTMEVLRDISFTIQPGEFVAILGASGCGKTTLLRIVDGLEMLTSGDVLINDVARPKPGPDRGFVFQSDTLFPWRTIVRNVAFGLELQGMPKKEIRERALASIDLVGLSGFENHYPHELSGGMRQRANLARALTIRPDLLLMDEPFAALDSQTRELMQAELLRIWTETDGGTVLFITHQIDEAVYLADRIIVLTSRPGRIKGIVDVDFERPRTLDLKRDPEFSAVVNRVWQMIEAEVRASMEFEQATDGRA